MDFREDRRIVLTLDAGGTHFVFGAMRGGQEAVAPVTLLANGQDLGACLDTLTAGFQQVQAALAAPAAAISFAFPGPADYPAGIIGDLGNLPCFRGGVPLGPMLEHRFGLPVFINNDGDLFAYGEAMAGLLPETNAALAASGSPKRFRNLFGITLGTGFGAGLVHDGRLYLGDNGAAAEIWCTRNKLDPTQVAEEGASIRAVRRVYAEQAGLALAQAPQPKEIHAIARGAAAGDPRAAREAFRRLGETVGSALAEAVTLVDALVVVGGGLAGAAEFILPALVAEMNAPLGPRAGAQRLEVQAFNLEDPAERAPFLKGASCRLPVPGCARWVDYDPLKRVGVGRSRLGTSHAVAMGAYAFALARL